MPAGYLVAMSENDKDPQQGEFTDPTASPDWTAPTASTGPQDPAPSSPEEPAQTSDAPQTEQIPQSSPTEQLPQGSEFPLAAPGPSAPSYDAPYQAPRGESYPYAGSSAQPTNPYDATPPPPPAGDPYAAPQPAYDPYAATGSAAMQGGYPAYQAPGQWQAPPPGYGAAPTQNTSALVLTIISGITTVTCCLPGIIPLIFGILALTKNSTDPEGSRKMAKWGWIAYAACIILSILAVVAFIVVGASTGMFDDGGYGSDSDYTY